jgi:uncharacterized membrane protein YczE
MSVVASIKHEVKSILLTTLYFAAWFLSMLALKDLILAEHRIEVVGVSKALIGALIVAKAVLILDRVPLTGGPAWVDVLVGTALFALGVFVVLIAERGIEGRHGPEGFFGAVRLAFTQAGPHHVGATTICVIGALLGYNAFGVLRAHVGLDGLRRMFVSPLPRPHRGRPVPADTAP